MIPFICNIQNKQIPKKQSKPWLPGPGEKQAEEVTVNGCKISFWGEDILKLYSNKDITLN